MAQDNAQRLDASQQPYYLLLCLQRWLNLVLDLIAAGIAVGTLAVTVLLRGSTTGGQVGVALNIIIVANTTLLRLVEWWTTLEISLGTISRLREVETAVPREEEPGEDVVPGEGWPWVGGLELKGVSASYG
jgi:ATP-binding cassette subfamily C (CFTR/MRP) protein 1